jgi:Uma2 family endonuclease
MSAISTISPPRPPKEPEGETRIAIRDVPWTLYRNLVDSLPENSGIRTAYDGADLEIMTKGRQHENYSSLFGRLVDVVTEELAIPCSANRETTWKRDDVERGLEADQCYYFRAEKLAAAAASKARGSNNVADYPNPDMAIEIDISASLVDRPGIYAALGVSEVWRFDGESLLIEWLGAEGRYSPVESSGWLPIRADEVVRWLTEEDRADSRRGRGNCGPGCSPSCRNGPGPRELGAEHGLPLAASRCGKG